MLNCKHQICRDDSIKGSAIIPYKNCESDSENFQILLGEERFGRYADSYSIFAGKMEGSCKIFNAMRELHEESKILINDFEEFDKIFKMKNGKYRSIVTSKTIVFFGKFENLDIDSLNEKIKLSNEDESLPDFQKEMSNVCWFNLKNNEKEQKKLSRFSKCVINILGKRFYKILKKI